MIDDRIKSTEYIELRENIEIIQENLEELLPLIEKHTDRLNTTDQHINRLRHSIIELYPVLSRFREEFDDYYTLKRKVDRDTNLLAAEYFSILEQNKKRDWQLKKLNVCITFLIIINTMSLVKKIFFWIKYIFKLNLLCHN